MTQLALANSIEVVTCLANF